eukprot:1150651-Pelagomonas_calceolata.AAC.3
MELMHATSAELSPEGCPERNASIKFELKGRVSVHDPEPVPQALDAAAGCVDALAKQTMPNLQDIDNVKYVIAWRSYILTQQLGVQFVDLQASCRCQTGQ